MILTGRNVLLRPLMVADAEITHKWRESPRAFLLNRGARSVVEQRRWIAARQFAPRSEMNFIQQLTTGEPVGMISLLNISPTHKHAEIGHFLIGEPDLVRPYGPGKIAAESTRLIYELAFDTLGLRSHWGPVAAENKQMMQWNAYFGARIIGRLTDHYFLNDHWQDAVLFQMTEEDYRTVAVPRLRGFLGF